MKLEELFSKLIKILDNNKITYAIVGRTEEYPYNIGSDVDIIIPLEMIEKFQANIWELETSSIKIVQMFQHEIVAFYYIVFNFSNNDRIYIQPDVCTDYYRKGRKLLNADYLLQNTIEAPQGGFKILSPEKEFIYYLIKKIDKLNISKEQFNHIYHCYMQNNVACIAEAQAIWQEKQLKLIQQIFQSNNYTLLKNNCKLLQDGIHCSKEIAYIDFIKNSYLKVKRILYPTGYVISIMGPDGSGKTTVINHLKKDISPAFRKIQQYHLFPKIETNSIINSNPQGQKKRGLFLSILKLIYLICIYNWGYFKLVFPARIRSTLIIFDRYYDDILIDALRYRNGTPNWVVKFFGYFIPKPQLWIILDAPTDIIQERKAEVTPTETERQRRAYRKFAIAQKNATIVDTNKDIDSISIEICKFICKSLNLRTTKRYKK